MKHAANQTNQDVLQFLGIDAKNVAAVDIELRPNQAPAVRVTQLIVGAKVIQAVNREYTLVPKDPDQPLNLDALCSLARTAVSVVVDRAAKHHLKEMGEHWAATDLMFWSESLAWERNNASRWNPNAGLEQWLTLDAKKAARDYYDRLYAESAWATP